MSTEPRMPAVMTWPANWNEDAYLSHHPDVQAAVQAGAFSSGFDHYVRHGQYEQRGHGLSKQEQIAAMKAVSAAGERLRRAGLVVEIPDALTGATRSDGPEP